MPADEWATFFATFASDLAVDRDLERVTDVIVSRVVEVFPEADGAALTVRRRRGFTTLAAGSSLAREVDQLQLSLREGPLVDPPQDAAYVRSGDLAHESRWGGWGAGAAERGVRSMVSLVLTAGSETVGALTVYAARTGAFDDETALGLGTLYATHAAHALAAKRLVSGLRTAMESRHTIGVAQGILMRRYDLDVESAFALLSRYSSRLNIKLRNLAEYVVQHGNLPEDVQPDPVLGTGQDGAPSA